MTDQKISKRDRFYADIIITAVEGGTNYWAYSREYSWAKDDEDPTLTRAQLCDMEAYDTDEEKWHNVTTSTIAHAYYTIRKDSNLGISSQARARFGCAFEDLDAGDLDANDADTIVQIGLFGKVIYG